MAARVAGHTSGGVFLIEPIVTRSGTGEQILVNEGPDPNRGPGKELWLSNVFAKLADK